MDVKDLEYMGLTNKQARAYIVLLEHGSCTAPKLSWLLEEGRSNAYKILDKLCELGLASKDTRGKRVYSPSSPTALERLVETQAEQARLRSRRLDAVLPDMLNFFFAHSEQPSIRYFQGREALQHVFGDMLKTGKDIYLLRSPGDVKFYDEAFFAEFRKKRAKLGIRTYALTPDVPSAVHNLQTDFESKFVRTWIPANAYTADVEWDVYGDKVALISYGKEAIATIIESPQIAESFRQVFGLLLTFVSLATGKTIP